MDKHRYLPVESPHLGRWPVLFAQTADDVCPPAAAALSRGHGVRAGRSPGYAGRSNRRLAPCRATFGVAPVERGLGDQGNEREQREQRGGRERPDLVEDDRTVVVVAYRPAGAATVAGAPSAASPSRA